MRGEQITLLLLLAVAVKNIECSRHHDLHAKRVKQHHNFKYHSCQQPDCKKCLSVSSQCQWCSGGSKRSKCVEIRGSDITDCPQGLKPTTCEPKLPADEKRAKIVHNSYYDKSLDELEAMVTPRMISSEQNSDFNASAFCGRQSECNNCTENEYCLWCASKQECQAFSNSSTKANSCPEENKAYHRQCIYPMGVIPCPERHNCSDCLHGDDFCYYCSSNDSCDYYRESHHGNKCPRNNLFYDECPTGGSLFWVLFPILAIILIPVIVYAVIWLICWCMKSAGYDPLDPNEPPPKKHPKGIRLKPGSPSNRTDELRRKYDLDNS